MLNRLLITAAAAALTLTGCIQRTISINSEPEGALVHLNDVEVGRTPLSVPFTFYGTYDVRLEKEGYDTLHVPTKADAPWWEAPGPDLVAEALPGERRVDLQWDYVMTPTQPTSAEALVDRAKQLRATFRPEAETPAKPPEAPAPASPQ